MADNNDDGSIVESTLDNGGIFNENQYVEYKYEEDYENAEYAFGVCVAFLILLCVSCGITQVIAIGCTCHHQQQGHDPQNETNIQARRCGVASQYTCIVLGCFWVTTMIFLMYSLSLQDRDGTDYHGLMFCKGFELKWEIRCTGGGGAEQSCRNEEYYVPTYSVEFGYGWACPDHTDDDVSPNKPLSCEAEMTSLNCVTQICEQPLVCVDENSGRENSLSDHKTYYVDCGPKMYLNCTDEVREIARQQAMNCIQHQGECDPRWKDQMIQYDPQQGPSNPQQEWPTVMGFGNCDACTADIHVFSNEDLEQFRMMGFLCLGLSFVVAIGLGGLHYWQIQREDQKNAANQTIQNGNNNNNTQSAPPPEGPPIQAPHQQHASVVVPSEISYEPVVVANAKIVDTESTRVAADAVPTVAVTPIQQHS